MRTFNETLKYSEKKKQHQVLKLKDSNLLESIDDLGGFLSDKKKRSTVGSRFEYISSWHIWAFLNEFFQNEKVNFDELALSTYFGVESNNWDFAVGKLSPNYDSAIPFDRSIMHLGQLLYLGWYDKAEKYGKLLLQMLYGKQYNGWVIKPLYAWFVITLFCKWQKIELDKTELKYPDQLGVYEEALANWDVIDQRQLNDIVEKLSAFHIAQSDEDVVTDEDGNEFSPEFTSSDYFIFPAEILAWLAIRKTVGLSGYNGNDELMKLEINQLPSAVIEKPKNELVDKCKRKLLEDNPGLQFEM